ncbi:FAD-dependent monooxygenase [Actinacidiphila acididurans]|uniref:FAD-dependent monooxygenase n=1 Tax=Actinacidiphila acididurans TaxID=2784346 RepID=A0ABS2TT50_9ACTN|nr:FAD-dependent monooxygenase [Actinacidiphila acididurans]MBM9506514.1 FAD-dependent monooxygenase [Actinacidiphila acididurans]
MSDPIVVIGAGPVGLTAAGELARRGVPVRIFDQLAQPTGQSRAILVHARSLEMLERIGVVEEIIAAGVRTEAMELHTAGRSVGRIELGLVDSPFPYTVTIAQTETERILTAALARNGVSVERGITLTGLDQDDSGVRAVLRHADGREEGLAASWLVGADGGHSSVRHLVGSALAGSFHGERFLMGDVHAAHDFDPHTMYTFFSPHAGPLLVFPMTGDRMRLIAQIPDGAQGPATQEWLQQVVDERCGRIRIRNSLWLTTFDIHHAQVPQYRVGRVFLAGDAAHVHSPAGGQGMNTGIQDAYNLGWKLALGRTGPAGSALLDSYHAERHPVGAQVIAFTTALTRAGTLAGPIAQKLRDGAMHAFTALAPVRLAMADKTEETSLSYRHSPLVVASPGRPHLTGGDHLPHAGDALRAVLAREAGHVLLTLVPGEDPVPPPVAGVPVSGLRQILVSASGATRDGYDQVLADPSGTAAARYALPRGGRVLIRPDGYVAAVASLEDQAPLHAYGALLSAAGSGAVGVGPAAG